MKIHKHRCMRCNEEFDCRTPSECQANYQVLPNIVTRGDDGEINILPHCPERPDWAWIRSYGDRMRALGHIEVVRARYEQGLTPPTIEQWKAWGVIEIAVRNPNVAEYCKHWEERAEKAEAQLAAVTGKVTG